MLKDAKPFMAPNLDGSKMADGSTRMDRTDGSAPNDGSSGKTVLGKDYNSLKGVLGGAKVLS